jgi:uncharacterized DUF497 family protein
LRFEWDSEKNESNYLKHGITFEEAVTVFDDDLALTIYDESHSGDEERFVIIGMSRSFIELFVCHCYRNGDEVTRIISARRATKNEIKLYERGRLI